MTTKRIIREAFYEYDVQMEKVYERIELLKEHYSYEEQELLLEGFWDTIKKAAKGVGGFLGTAVGTVHKLGDEVWDKGVKLGQKVVDIAKNLIAKISEAVNSFISIVKSAPSKLWESVKELCSSIADETGEIWKKAKEKGGEYMQQFQTTATQIWNTVAKGLSNAVTSFVDWSKKNTEQFVQIINDKKSELLEIAKKAEASTISDIKMIGSKLGKILTGTVDVAKYIGECAVGLVALPFYASYLAVKETYQLGEETISWVKAGIESIKNNVPEVWKGLQTEFQQKMAAAEATTEKRIMSFNTFVNENLKKYK